MRREIAGLVLAFSLPGFAQPPQVPIPQPQSFASQNVAFKAYQDCVAAHRPEVDLHNASRQVVQFRDHPGMLEGALQGPGASERAPGGAAGVMEQLFTQYRSLGGTAASIADVSETPTPCPPPTLEPRRAPPDDSARIRQTMSRGNQ